MPQLILLNPISMALAYRYFSFFITKTKVKVSIIMPLLMQFTTSRNQLHFQLNTRNQGRFIVLQRNYLLHFVDSIMKICLSILNWIQQKLKSSSGYNNSVASLTELNHGHSIIYMRNVSSFPMSKILILCFHCFGIDSIHLTCRFMQ